MIIDTHTHFYDPTRPQGVPWPSADTPLLYRPVLPAHWRALAAPEGVTGTVVVEASGWLEDNQWILDLAAQDGSLVGLVGHIDPNRPEFATELNRFAANPRFRGIRCGGRYLEDLTTGSFVEDMALLAAKNLALDVLLRKEHFAGLIALAQRLPDLRIVIDHIGHMPIDGKAISAEWVAHYQQLAAQPNLVMKVSALMEQSISYPAPTALDFYRPTLDILWQSFGADRLIYGSNWPVSERAGDFYHQGISLVKAYFQAKGPAAYDKYFWQNAQAVYQWPT
ncbi:MAG: amidohydrolase family protein [Caldilineaceae bacterium]|nr:amidohydrolase family protein [Caldilineaceae bacterium]